MRVAAVTIEATLRAIGFADFADLARLADFGAVFFLAALGAVLRDLDDALLIDFFGLATWMLLLAGLIATAGVTPALRVQAGGFGLPIVAAEILVLTNSAAIARAGASPCT